MERLRSVKTGKSAPEIVCTTAFLNDRLLFPLGVFLPPARTRLVTMHALGIPLQRCATSISLAEEHLRHTTARTRPLLHGGVGRHLPHLFDSFLTFYDSESAVHSCSLLRD